MKNGWRLLVAAGSGAIGALAYQPLGWWLAVLPAWFGIFWAVRGAGLRWGLRAGLVFGLSLNALSLTWLWLLFGTASPALWLILALFPCLAGGLVGWLSQRRPAAWWMPTGAASICLACEHYMGEWFWLRFPWITPGTGLGPTWLSPYVGVYGASWLVLAACACLALGAGRQRLAGAVLTAGVLALGLFRPGPVALPSTPPVPVLLIQSEACNFTDAFERTTTAGHRDGVVVWPEYTVGYDIRKFGPEEFDKLVKWSAENNNTMVIGTWQGRGLTTKADEDNSNTALTLDGSGELGRHAKCRPVHFFADGKPGKTMRPVATRHGLVGTPVCFDCDYVEIIRRMTAAGAEWFAVPSMDAIDWGERQHLQHQELFRHRALENGRWMAVAATSGRTWILDPHGRPHAQLPLFDPATVNGFVFREKGLTFFTRYGWTAPWIASALAVLSLLAAFRQPVERIADTAAPSRIS